MAENGSTTTDEPAKFNDVSSESQGQTAEDDGDLDYSDEEDEEYSDDELSTANPSDYTKAYNRQRRLNDPNVPVEQKPKSNPQRPKANTAALIDDQITSLARHANKLKLDAEQSGLGTKGDKGDHTDRANRATSEQVLDPRTRMILLQMINRGIVPEINGCISTGKEANVYHAVLYPEDTPDPAITAATAQEASTTVSPPAVRPVDTRPQHFAIKIFKTSILTFRDRSAYIQGDIRFKNGFKHRSNHSMVRLWAEKEFRNLKRLDGAGLPVPEPVYLRAHVLVMRFIGSKKGWSAPLLRDVSLDEHTAAPETEEQTAAGQTESNNLKISTQENSSQTTTNPWTHIYHTLLSHVRTMYQTCHLVHADLSEFNILYQRSPTPDGSGKACIIDVGQSVEPSHPNASTFLRNDIHNLTVFFGKQHAVPTLPESIAFAFVTADKGALDMPGMLDALKTLTAADAAADARAEGIASTDTRENDANGTVGGDNTEAQSQARRDQQREHDETVFRQQYMPQSLSQVYDVERDADKVARGEAHELVYASLLAPSASAHAPSNTVPAAAAPSAIDGSVDPATHLLSEAHDPTHESDSSPHTAGSGSDSADDDGPGFDDSPHKPRGKRFEDKGAKKEHKAAVKEVKREKRKTKMPKHVKNKLVVKSGRSGKK